MIRQDAWRHHCVSRCLQIGCGQLAEVVPVSRPAASQHLGILVQAGPVRSTSAGRNRWNELNPETLMDVEIWVRALLDIRADAPSLSLTRPPSRPAVVKEIT